MYPVEAPLEAPVDDDSRFCMKRGISKPPIWQVKSRAGRQANMAEYGISGSSRTIKSIITLFR